MKLSLLNRILLVVTGSLLAFDVTLRFSPPASAQSGDPANPCLVNDGGWQSTDGGCRDMATGLVWGSSLANLTSTSTTYAGALEYCSARVEGGYDDWRVPTKAELTGAAANGAGAHLNVLVPHGYLRWTVDRKGPKFAWGGRFSDGSGNWATQGSGLDVVCVR